MRFIIWEVKTTASSLTKCSIPLTTMMAMSLLLVASLLHVSSANFAFSGSSVDNERYKAGKEQYEMLQKETIAPRYSQCWLNALEGLESGCKALSEDVQHHLAIGFTNCFLMKTGREVYPCVNGQDISECTRAMTSDAFSTYTSFFTHTQNICYFLLAQVWQASTEKTIDSLKDTSDTVVQQMEDTSSRQLEIMESQDQLLMRGKQLQTTLQESTVDVHKMLSEFKTATDEQKLMIFEVFDRVNSLQATLLGELTGFYSLIFYTVSVIICYLVTSTPRSSGARFWLFCLMTVNMVTERLIVSFGSYSDDDERVYVRLWICRKCFTLLAVAVWSYKAYRWQDMNEINHKLLNDIQCQNKELKSLLVNSRMIPVDRTPSMPLPPLIPGSGDAPDAALAPSLTKVIPCRDDSDSEYSSSESGISDRTYRGEEGEGSDSDSCSFTTTESGRSTIAESLSLWAELRDIRQATPNRQMREAAQLKEILSPISPANSQSGSGRKPRTKRVWPVTRSYNLRKRSSTPASNPAVDEETEQEFSRKVKEMAKISAKNSQRVRATVVHQLNSGPFFSDED